MKLLTLLVGESGCGKSTLTDRLVNNFKGLYHKVLSTVSREPRKGEHNGEDYYFTSREEIEELQEKKELVQITEYGGNYYCTRMNDYFGETPISVLSVVPDHVMTVYNYFRQPQFASELMVHLLYFNSGDELLQRHLGETWEERVKRGNIRGRFLELMPHIAQHIPVEMIEDRMVNDKLHDMVHDLLLARLLSTNAKYMVETEGEMQVRNFPNIMDIEGSYEGITTVNRLVGCSEVKLHTPHLEKGPKWLPIVDAEYKEL